jgi:LacI family transcriptional regulator
MRAGVDKAVVSKIVNADPGLNVRADTRLRVEQAIADLGYIPNSTARTLRTSLTRTYGLLIPDFSNPVYAEVITGAEAAAAEQGYVLMTASARAVTSVTGQSAQAYIDILGQDRIDGLLIAGGTHNRDVLARLTDRGLPWLLVNTRDSTSHRFVALDDQKGAELAVGHLIDLGHRQIAHLAGPESADTAQRRRAGYTSALERVGISVDPALVVDSNYTSEGGYQATQHLIDGGVPFTAIFVANVNSAVGALHALNATGLSVPGDVSVIALHDHALAQHLIPSLTTVKMPLRELGARAVELLRTTSPTSDVQDLVRGPIVLLNRQSTGQPRHVL